MLAADFLRMACPANCRDWAGSGRPPSQPSPSAIRVRFQLKLSNALAAMIFTEQVDRSQVIKKLWDYIKAKNLQN